MSKKEKVHFIGIGGIGVSALAQYYLAEGWQVSGSDLANSEIIGMLREKGARVYIGKHKISNFQTSILPDVVIYSPAVQPGNPELVMAKKMGVKCLSYPEALGQLTKRYFTIAVSGAHGKSTTTSMLALVLKKAGLDPTIVVGTKLKEFGGTNFRMGKSKYLVIEADEWQASFLNYWPKIIILTNIDKEHLDYYRDLDHIIRTFKEYVGHLPKDGVLVANGDDENIQKLISSFKFQISKQLLNFKFKIKRYSIGQPEAKDVKSILKIPGEHNVSNALAVLTAARILGVSDKTALEALSEYQGAWRRFEIKEARIGDDKFTIVSDYGHHPNEVKATLTAARGKFSRQKIWCIFQPHQYQRTFYLFNDFVKVFSSALKNDKKRPVLDNLIITDIYSVAGREKADIKRKVSSQKIIKKIDKPQAIYLPFVKIKNFLQKNLKPKDVLIIMGAGDIYKLAEDLGKKCKNK